MKRKSLMLAGLLTAFPASQPARADVRPTMYGQWALACPQAMGSDAIPSCSIRFQSAGSRPGYAIDWEVFLDASGTSRFTTSGWSRATCRRITIGQEEGRLYRLTDASIPLWRMEDHAERLLDAMRSHVPAFGDCSRESGDSEAYPDSLLDGQQPDFTRALIAAETHLRGRGPDRNDGVTTTANLGGVTFRGSPASIDQAANIAAALNWYIDGRRRQSLTIMLPPNYAPPMFDALMTRIDAAGLHDLDIRLLGPYGPARVRR